MAWKQEWKGRSSVDAVMSSWSALLLADTIFARRGSANQSIVFLVRRRTNYKQVRGTGKQEALLQI